MSSVCIMIRRGNASGAYGGGQRGESSLGRAASWVRNFKNTTSLLLPYAGLRAQFLNSEWHRMISLSYKPAPGLIGPSRAPGERSEASNAQNHGFEKDTDLAAFMRP